MPRITAIASIVTVTVTVTVSVAVLVAVLVMLPFDAVAGVQAPPANPPLDRGTLTLRFNAHREHGCSRSFATYGHLGTLRLALKHPAAELTLELDYRSTFGRSRFSQPGQQGHSRRRERRRFSWRGAVQRTRGGALHLTLKLASARCEALPWYGTGAAAMACSSRPGAVRLTCKVGKVEALGPPPKGWPQSRAKKGEHSLFVSALRCAATTGSTLPEALRRAAYRKLLPFTRAPGLTLYERKGFGIRGESLILRHP